MKGRELEIWESSDAWRILEHNRTIVQLPSSNHYRSPPSLDHRWTAIGPPSSHLCQITIVCHCRLASSYNCRIFAGRLYRTTTQSLWPARRQLLSPNDCLIAVDHSYRTTTQPLLVVSTRLLLVVAEPSFNHHHRTSDGRCHRTTTQPPSPDHRQQPPPDYFSTTVIGPLTAIASIPSLGRCHPTAVARCCSIIAVRPL